MQRNPHSGRSFIAYELLNQSEWVISLLEHLNSNTVTQYLYFQAMVFFRDILRVWCLSYLTCKNAGFGQSSYRIVISQIKLCGAP